MDHHRFHHFLDAGVRTGGQTSQNSGAGGGCEWSDSAAGIDSNADRCLQKSIVGDYKHPVWMAVFGGFVALLMSGMGIYTLFISIPKLFA